jgi:peptide-methionine (R)-S-oxide reductase
MLTRRNFGLAGFGLAVAATGWRSTSSHANEEAMTTTNKSPFEITKTPEEWRKILTPEQFYVLREHGTERAGTSPLDKTYAAGTYDCAGCDLPLFSSDTKFNSGTGWPSFFKPLDNAVGNTVDKSLFMTRTEVHCRR